MAVDLYPYSGTRAGALTDAEHERLWGGVPDGVLPGQSANALLASTAGATWTVQPGRFRIAGHVLDVDAVQSGALPGGAASTRTSVVAAYIDRTQTPWAKGIRLVLGTPGGGRPTLASSPTGVYEVALRAFTTAPSGATTLLADDRPYTTGMPWQPYSPAPTGLGTSSFTPNGIWRRVDVQTVDVTVEIWMNANGAGSGVVQIKLPTAPWRGIRQTFHGHAENPGAVLEAVCFTSGSGLTVDRILAVSSTSAANLIGSAMPRDRIITLSGRYREAT